LTLYKFRSLGKPEELERVKKILETGCFWCSRFSELNGPMEGVYRSFGTQGMDQVYCEKKSYMICSFSLYEAFINPAMWGYYAGGFKGVAIEIHVSKTVVKQVNYCSDTLNFGDNTPDVMRILTSKLNPWKHEAEYRFLKKTPDNLQSVGEIVAVHYAEPYRNTINHESVYSDTEPLRSYEKHVRVIKDTCIKKNIKCIPIRISKDRIETSNQS